MRLLLDANLSPDLVDALRQLGADTECVRDWRGGEFLDADDERILIAASEDQRILVTADSDSISQLVRLWASAHQTHHGIIFLHNNDRRRANIGPTSRRIVQLLSVLSEADWTDRLVHLPAAGRS